MLLKANKFYYKGNNSDKCEKELDDNFKIKKYYKNIKNKYETNK